ncbi:MULTISPECIES: glycosyltransferase family 4 protein [unclassified Clostridium]|uniref:glycosyltransferase family 4 protein n=1 Tax=unclassified Clostridium TaxID=2614128 RepID=UPI001C8BED1F|nr:MULTISPECIES: glycosyltransferase family 4 protein [unclassified Clostridium]MBX9136329.1 glycosyltransferase family 4 protein [Clostridium sp. K12(2020)]MBX9143399.1 glycosyltransferase family 4 protein [Clostridium sp. K13]
MKKILYITTLSRTINAFLIPHIEMLLDNGYQVDCACANDQNINKILLNKGVRIFGIPFSRSPLKVNNLKAFMRLREIQKINNYDIVHVHTPIAAIYGRLLKLSYPNLKTIYTAHGYHFLKGGSKLAWLVYYPIEKIMAKLTDVIININKEDYEITKEKLKPRISYLLNGVGLDLSKYKKLSNDEILEKKKELGITDNDFIVLMIAELNKNKNHIQLINAIDTLKKQYSNIKVFCIGDGDMREDLEQQIISRNLQNNIFMLGYRQDVNKLINISDIGILMSYREGLPRNIMEFMASGRKVIATNIRGCRDLICNETVGTLVNVGDYEETAKAIEKYYLSRDREFNVSNEIKKYDIESVNSELLKIYESIELEINYEKGMSSYVSNRVN